MEVKKLYYEDCHLREFSAEVTGCEETKDGWQVTLSATAFYPEGGGQACDVGTLADARVLDVQERDGEIFHLCHRPLKVGQQVTGKLNWARRFDLMQQHSGEHMVSGVIHRRYGYHNVGFHMGADVVTIDFDGPIPPEDLPAIQQEVNTALWQNLPLLCWYPSPQELPNIPYRCKRALPWPVRIVQIPGIDSCACCGVHVAATGEIGLVMLLSCVKFHEGVRIEMVCGERAMALLNRVYEQNRQVSQAFSAKPLETGEAARRMNEQLAAEKFRAVGLQRQVFASIAEKYKGCPHAVHFEADLQPGQVRELAQSIHAVCPLSVVLSGTDDAGYSICMAGEPEQVKALGGAIAQQLNGRGGGKPGFYQGSVRATKNALVAFFCAQTSTAG